MDTNALDILVVDDEQSICLLLRDLLIRFGHQVTVCNDGGAAVQVAAGRAFDIVFMDMRMPGMGGLEALKQLHQLHPNATYIMMTGYAQTEVVDEALSAGASACLCKPFSLTHIQKLLKALTEKEPVPA